MFARQTRAGYEPTGFTNSRGVWMRTGTNGSMVHPFRAGVGRDPIGRVRRIEEGESAHRANALFGKNNKPQKSCKGATGRCVWEEYFDVILRLGGMRMDLWMFWWTDGMHTPLLQKENVWPLLKGGKQRAEPVRPALSEAKKIVARQNRPKPPRADVLQRAKVWHSIGVGFRPAR